ncbi:hypothetical protein [Streptomyces sp. NRRL S-350]|uniref:hypothetical protein n=1 Tax=Streptomyces sp. NRRL S-350 TaxID=1463902 RepID=UPI0004C28FAB|nr:hypothetical protein [Streptomyces sp. NRRL S-350]
MSVTISKGSTKNHRGEFEFMYVSAIRGVGEKVERVIPGASEWMLSVATQADGYGEVVEFWEVIGQELRDDTIKRRGSRKARQLAKAREAFSTLVSAVESAAVGEMEKAARSVQRAWSLGWAGVN